MRRLSISLDEETFKLVEKMQEDTKTSKADVLRMLIRTYHEQNGIFKGHDTETILIYLDYLGAGESVILDVDLFSALMEEVADPTEDFLETVRQSGREHGAQYRKKGMKNLQDILFYMSKSNLFRMKKISPDFYALIFCPIKNLKILMNNHFKFKSLFLHFCFHKK